MLELLLLKESGFLNLCSAIIYHNSEESSMYFWFVFSMIAILYLIAGLSTWCLWYYRNYEWARNYYTDQQDVMAATFLVTLFWPIYIVGLTVGTTITKTYLTLGNTMDVLIEIKEKEERLKLSKYD